MDVSAKNTKSGNLMMIPPKRRMRMKTGQELGGKTSPENGPAECQKSRLTATQRRFDDANLTAETVTQSQG